MDRTTEPEPATYRGCLRKTGGATARPMTLVVFVAGLCNRRAHVGTSTVAAGAGDSSPLTTGVAAPWRKTAVPGRTTATPGVGGAEGLTADEGDGTAEKHTVAEAIACSVADAALWELAVAILSVPVGERVRGNDRMEPESRKRLTCKGPDGDNDLKDSLSLPGCTRIDDAVSLPIGVGQMVLGPPPGVLHKLLPPPPSPRSAGCSSCGGAEVRRDVVDDC